MPILYNIGIKIYYLLILFASLFNLKAKQWINGRKHWRNNWVNRKIDTSIWFHFASLGEFEQGKPLLEACKNKFPDKKIVITFFSPSGYEVRKNSPLGDYILYLPLDTKKNATDFISIFKPELAFFNKYEFWYHFFKILNKNQIPFFVTSAIFRPDQQFFKKLGGFNRKIIRFATHFFVQNQESANLLASIGLNNYTISGDTRFDSVNNLSNKIQKLPVIEKFKNSSPLIIAGSTWQEDEMLLADFIHKKLDGWKVIFAPHEIKEEKIAALAQLFKGNAITYSELIKNPDGGEKYNILIINNIGMLSSLYTYGQIAYIGGGFGAGIHNTLEAATWGLPVIFGPHYKKFQEAKDLIEIGAGFTINDASQLEKILNSLIEDKVYREECGSKAKQYVKNHIGATDIIMKKVFGTNV